MGFAFRVSNVKGVYCLRLPLPWRHRERGRLLEWDRSGEFSGNVLLWWRLQNSRTQQQAVSGVLRVGPETTQLQEYVTHCSLFTSWFCTWNLFSAGRKFHNTQENIQLKLANYSKQTFAMNPQMLIWNSLLQKWTARTQEVQSDTALSKACTSRTETSSRTSATAATDFWAKTDARAKLTANGVERNQSALVTFTLLWFSCFSWYSCLHLGPELVTAWSCIIF